MSFLSIFWCPHLSPTCSLHWFAHNSPSSFSSSLQVPSSLRDRTRIRTHTSNTSCLVTRNLWTLAEQEVHWTNTNLLGGSGRISATMFWGPIYYPCIPSISWYILTNCYQPRTREECGYSGRSRTITIATTIRESPDCDFRGGATPQQDKFSCFTTIYFPFSEWYRNTADGIRQRQGRAYIRMICTLASPFLHKLGWNVYFFSTPPCYKETYTPTPYLHFPWSVSCSVPLLFGTLSVSVPLFGTPHFQSVVNQKQWELWTRNDNYLDKRVLTNNWFLER